MNFKRTGNVKKSLGIGYEAKIRKFFRDLNIPDYNYKIEPNGEILFLGNLVFNNANTTELPDKLVIGGYLDISFTYITKLPDDIKVKGPIYVNSNQTELIDFIKTSDFFYRTMIWP